MGKNYQAQLSKILPGVTAIVGMGNTGKSALNFLYKNDLPLIINDSRNCSLLEQEILHMAPGIRYKLGEFSLSFLRQAENIMLSPGVDPNDPDFLVLRSMGKKFFNDISLFSEIAIEPLLGVTGSNGKTTVSTMLASLLRLYFPNVGLAGNIGFPVLKLLSDEDNERSYTVLELSSFQLELVKKLKLRISLFLNASPDHLDRHLSMNNYIACKQNIFLNSDIIIFNREDSNTYPIHSSSSTRLISFGLDEPKDDSQLGIKYVGSNPYLAWHNKTLLAVEDLSFRPWHQVKNVLAVLAVAIALKLELDPALNLVKNFTGLPHRCEYIGNYLKFSWYNDSKATNVGATFAALEGLGPQVKGKIVLLAGGIAKENDFSALFPLLKKYCRFVILYGRDREIIALALKSIGFPYLMAEDLFMAVNFTVSMAKAGDTILLSPFCASLDQFKDFNHRGEEFKKIVLSLEN